MARIVLILLSFLFVTLVIAVPVAAVFHRAFSEGMATCGEYLDEETLLAIRLTVLTALIVLPLNVIFGVAAAWLIARYRFFGRRALLIIIEAPFAISPIVAGLCFLLVYGAYGPVGGALAPYGVQLMFNLTGIALVSLFVTCPFVVRELLPVLMVTGEDEEKAAITLGANGWHLFRFGFCQYLVGACLWRGAHGGARHG